MLPNDFILVPHFYFYFYYFHILASLLFTKILGEELQFVWFSFCLFSFLALQFTLLEWIHVLLSFALAAA